MANILTRIYRLQDEVKSLTEDFRNLTQEEIIQDANQIIEWADSLQNDLVAQFKSDTLKLDGLMRLMGVRRECNKLKLRADAPGACRPDWHNNEAW